MPGEKQTSSPFSTGGGGSNFETHIQAMFTIIMLSGGVAPCLPRWPIKKIKLQGKYVGFNTDDCVVFTKEPNGKLEAKLLAQIKHSVSITESDKTFGEVIQAAWLDFHNTELFDPEKDAIALITGPLSEADIENVRTITEWARSSENAAEFIMKVEKANFSSDLKRSKLKAFRSHLDKTKGGRVSDEDLWRFTKSFHLLSYDLDIKSGADLSLIHSLINQFDIADPHRMWTQVADEVRSANQNAGTISLETIPIEIINTFRRRPIQEIPEEFVKQKEPDISEASGDLALAMLLGSWDESVEYDKKAAEKLSSRSYGEWIGKLRTVVVQPESPLIQKNRKWRIANRLEFWNAFGLRIFDKHLDTFKEIVVNVLREPDPKFGLPKEEHYAARVKGRVLLHSETLRKGLAETLALLGSYPKTLASCSLHKAEVIATLCVRDILSDADWLIWASLNDLLPLLAEASPTEFLDAVEKTIEKKGGETFQKVFELEGSGIGGWNYMSGVLSALETLAWHPDYLTRATILLGQLGEIDPGGQWANRPINSLTTIFLPWFPQTDASVEKRKLAVESVLRECPAVGWKLLLTLLPAAHQVSSGSRKPKWRELIARDLLDKVTGKDAKVSTAEYFEQVRAYVSLAITNAKGNFERVHNLIPQLDDLPNPEYAEFLSLLESDEIISLAEDQRVELWEELTSLVLKHRKFSDAKWALPPDEVDKIAAVADKIKPSSPSLVHKRLFSSHEPELYEEKGNYEEQRRKIEDLRSKAIEEILTISGIDSVIEFSKSVDLPFEVGLALGRIGQAEHDAYFLPANLTVEERPFFDIASGYVWSRFHKVGWQWVDDFETINWTDQQKAALFAKLPFTRETWQRVERLLGEKESLYWKVADARPYQLKDQLEEAVRKLNQNGRPRAAINCLQWMIYEKMKIPLDCVYQALISALASEEPPHTLDQHRITELIKWLQQDRHADKNILSQIEWIYLRLLDHLFGNTPVTLEQKLADDPNFFCEAVRTVFRSKKQQSNEVGITEERKHLAEHVFQLLWHWQTPPGTSPDESFNVSKLREWIAQVRKSCEESGHIDIALDQIGKILAHSPEDPSGLWIHKGVAEILNDKDGEIMRNAYCVQRFNMRGAHWGSGGKVENEIATDYRKKAEAIDNYGFFRFADSLRKLADQYQRDAEREASNEPFDI